MATYKYTGADVNLGRFGRVKKGDVLDLTTREEEHIQDDKRFEKHDPAKEKKGKPELSIKLPDGFDKLPEAEQKKIRAALEKEEKARLAMLADQNAKRQSEEIDQLRKPQLLELAEKMRKDGKPIDYKDENSAKQLRKAIKAVLFGGNVPDDDDAGAEEE